MATIELSSGFMSSFTTRMFGLGTFTNGVSSADASIAAQAPLLNSPGSFNTSNTAHAWIYIMKGVVPANFTTLTSFGARSADVLCTYTPGTQSVGNFSPAVLNTNPARITTDYTIASASGTATWFWWVLRKSNSGSYNNTDALINQIIGTIGPGLDLDIPDTNLVAGVAYRVSNLRLQFPTSWTF